MESLRERKNRIQISEERLQSDKIIVGLQCQDFGTSYDEKKDTETKARPRVTSALFLVQLRFETTIVLLKDVVI